MNKTLVRSSPVYADVFRPLGSMFDDFFAPTRNLSLNQGLMDVYEDDRNVYAEIDAPSYEPSDISIEVDGRRMTISGKKEEEKTDKRYKIKERSSSSFVRTFVLEEPIDETRVVAEIKDGVLVVTIPKSAKIEPKRIEIKKK